MSGRANAIYERFARDIEIYSIDESFLDLTDVAPGQRVELARDLRSTVRAWMGLPTCVGIGPTKTLAKLANHIAKKVPRLEGVCDLSNEAERDRWLARVPLADIWGVGRASQARLAALGCRTVVDVRDLDPRGIRKGMTVVGERIIYELRGVPCIDMETVVPTKFDMRSPRYTTRLDELPVVQAL